MLELIPLLINNISEQEALNNQTGEERKEASSRKPEKSSERKKTKQKKGDSFTLKSLALLVDLNLDPDEDPILFLKLLYESLKELKKLKSKTGSSLLMKDLSDWKKIVKREIDRQEGLFVDRLARGRRSVDEELLEFFDTEEGREGPRDSFEFLRSLNKYGVGDHKEVCVRQEEVGENMQKILKEIDF